MITLGTLNATKIAKTKTYKLVETIFEIKYTVILNVNIKSVMGF